MMIHALILAIAGLLTPEPQLEPAPLPAILSNTITGEIGLTWEMSPTEAKAALGMRMTDSTSKLMKFKRRKQTQLVGVDSVTLYYDEKGISFMRIEHAGRDYKGALAKYRERHGEPWESNFIVTRWTDSTGRWLNLFSARGKRGSAGDHIIVNISRDRAMIGNLPGKL